MSRKKKKIPVEDISTFCKLRCPSSPRRDSMEFSDKFISCRSLRECVREGWMNGWREGGREADRASECVRVCERKIHMSSRAVRRMRRRRGEGGEGGVDSLARAQNACALSVLRPLRATVILSYGLT
jgi:hypothetical protein